MRTNFLKVKSLDSACSFMGAMALSMLLFSPLHVQGQQLVGLLSKPDDWFGTIEAKSIAENILLYQRNAGGWTLNQDYLKDYSSEQKIRISNEKNKRDCSFRDHATFTELEYLAKIFTVTPSERYRDAFNRGLDLIFEAQYENGGWPKHYPEPYTLWFKGVQSKWNPSGFEHYIAYNDDAMVGILRLLKKVAEAHHDFDFVDDVRKEKAISALKKGIDCTLKIQYHYDGRLTAWPQQADEITLEPRWGRFFEPAAITTRESVEIVRFLMSLENPDLGIIRAIHSAVKWFDKIKILNTAVITHPDTFTAVIRPGLLATGRHEIHLEHKYGAPPVWARFYELNTFRPVFCSSDDTVRYDIADISAERRTGYDWYGRWPEKLLEIEYPEWCKKHGQKHFRQF